ncbi:MAG: glycosyltransferase family A protein [Steroidobacteraceae bacterium]
MGEPLVSVIVAVRNGERYLTEALDSVALQQVEDLEIIVVDDGSTDDSAGLAARHATRPRVVSRPPLGQPAAINEGIRQSRGRYIALLDCDDVWPPGRLNNMLAAFELKGESVDLVFGILVNTNSVLQPFGAAGPARMPTAGLLRRTAVVAVGEFRTDVAHGANVDWISRAKSMGLRFEMIDTPVLLRRVHGDNIGRQRDTARVDMLKVIRDHHARQKN